MAKFYSKKFKRQIEKSLQGEAMKKKAYVIAKNKAERAHKEMMEEFDSHPVTKEIIAGPDAVNLSGALGGYGNLFTFIGFHKGTRPTALLRDYLKGTGMIFRQPRVLEHLGATEFRFKIDTPKRSVVEDLTPSPWEGRSWTRGVERGISGLGHYMYTQNENVASRSGAGIQKQNKIRTLAFRPIKYMPSIIDSFYKKTK